MTAPARIPVALRRAPFSDATDRYEIPAGLTLAEIVAAVPDLPPGFAAFGVVTVNGEAVPREWWGRVRPRPDGPAPARVGLHLLPGRGNEGKSSLALFASIAVIAAATLVSGGALAGVLGPGFAAGATGARLAAAGVSIAGALAVQALAPAPVPLPRRADGTVAPLGEAAIGGNLLGPYQPVPRCLGKIRVAPSHATPPWTEIDGDDQFVNAILALDGQHLLENVRFGETLADSMDDVDIETFEGWDSDGDPTLITQTANQDQVNVTLSRHQVDDDGTALLDQATPANSYPQPHVFTTKTAMDETRLTMFWPILAYNGGSGSAAAGLPLRLRLRRVADENSMAITSAAWSNGPEIHISRERASPFRLDLRVKFGLPAETPDHIGTSLAVARSYYDQAGTADPWVADGYFDPGTFAAGDLSGATGYGCAFSPDGKYLAVGHGTSPYLFIYDIENSWAKLTNPVTLPAGQVNGIAWSPEGDYLAVAHDASPYVTIYTFPALSKLANPATLPAGNGHGVAFSPAGDHLAVAHANSPYATIYTFPALSKLANPATLPAGHGNGIAFTPAGDHLAVAHDSSPYATIYTFPALSKLANPATLPTGIGRGIAFSPAGGHLAVAHDSSPYATIYTFPALSKLANPATLPTGNAKGVAFSYDGKYLAFAHVTSPRVTIYTFPALSKLANPATLPSDNGNGVALSPNYEYLCVAHDNFAGFGFTAYLFFSLDAIPPAWASNVIPARHVGVTKNGIEIYLDPDSWPKGKYEIELKRGFGYAASNMAYDTYLLSGADPYFFKDSGGSLPVDQNKAPAEVTIQSVTSIWNELPIGEKGCALIAVRARNRRLETLTVEATPYAAIWDGHDWTGVAPTSNPAALFRHIIKDAAQNAKPVAAAQIDDAILQTWYDQCVTDGRRCGAIAAGEPVDELLRVVAGCGRAALRRSDKWGVAIEKDRSAEDPIQPFSPRNSRGFAVEKAFPDRVHGFICRFVDAENGYAEREITVYDDGFDAATATRMDRITYRGLLTEKEVADRALFDLRSLRLRAALYGFDVSAEHIRCIKGDLVLLSQDFVDRKHGSGRIVTVATSGGNVTGLTLDAPLPLSEVTTGGVDIVQTDGDILTKQINETADTATISFATPFAMPTSGGEDLIKPGYLVIGGEFGSEAKRCIVAAIEAAGDITAHMTLVDEAQGLYA